MLGVPADTGAAGAAAAGAAEIGGGGAASAGGAADPTGGAADVGGAADGAGAAGAADADGAGALGAAALGAGAAGGAAGGAGAGGAAPCPNATIAVSENPTSVPDASALRTRELSRGSAPKCNAKPGTSAFLVVDRPPLGLHIPPRRDDRVAEGA